MDNASKFADIEGCRIKFKNYDGAYVGDVKAVSKSLDKMMVRKCIFLPDNICVGTLFVSIKEVSAIEVIRRRRASFMKNPTSYLEQWDILPANGDATKASESAIEDFSIFPSFSHLSARVSVISSFGEEMENAVEDLKTSSVIGVSLEGPSIGRFGIIHWLCASANRGTYLFDLQRLGRKVFDLGLREILESSCIEKVIHDCKGVSDALFHLYRTKISKVFDTQVADAFVNLQINSSDFKGSVNSLDCCLKTHLNITEEYLPQSEENVSYPQKVKLSMFRPISDHQKNIMVKNVVYLASLKNKLKLKMLNPFQGAVETYLKCVASKSDKELKFNPHDPAQLPQELLVEDKWEAVEYKETPHIPINETLNLPYTGQYSFVNKMNELRTQNPHMNASEIHSKIKVPPRRFYYNYPDPASFDVAKSEKHSDK